MTRGLDPHVPLLRLRHPLAWRDSGALAAVTRLKFVAEVRVVSRWQELRYRGACGVPVIYEELMFKTEISTSRRCNVMVPETEAGIVPSESGDVLIE